MRIPKKKVHDHIIKYAPFFGESVKPAFHNTDTDILARILADTFDTRDFRKLFLWQAERGSRPTRRHLATILAKMSVSVSWNAALTA